MNGRTDSHCRCGSYLLLEVDGRDMELKCIVCGYARKATRAEIIDRVNQILQKQRRRRQELRQPTKKEKAMPLVKKSEQGYSGLTDTAVQATPPPAGPVQPDPRAQGELPKDTGRPTVVIYHQDGNINNDDPANLVQLPIVPGKPNGGKDQNMKGWYESHIDLIRQYITWVGPIATKRIWGISPQKWTDIRNLCRDQIREYREKTGAPPAAEVAKAAARAGRKTGEPLRYPYWEEVISRTDDVIIAWLNNYAGAAGKW